MFLPLDSIQIKPVNEKLRQIGGTAKLVIDVIKYEPAVIKVFPPFIEIPNKSSLLQLQMLHINRKILWSSDISCSLVILNVPAGSQTELFRVKHMCNEGKCDLTRENRH